MDQKERKHFWDVLCSLQGTDVQSEAEELAKTIILPRYLYRYRAVSINTIDALQRNCMYFSNANYYDDPFDTLIHIDFDKIRDEGSKFLSSDQIRQQVHNLSDANVYLINTQKHSNQVQQSHCLQKQQTKSDGLSAEYFKKIKGGKGGEGRKLPVSLGREMTFF